MTLGPFDYEGCDYPVIRVKPLSNNYTLPKQAHVDLFGDVGYDVVAASIRVVDTDGAEIAKDCLSNKIHSIDYIEYNLGFAAQINNSAAHGSFYLEAVPNSRITKYPVHMRNSVGVIDPGYTGPILLRYAVTRSLTQTQLKDLMEPGRVIGQLLIRRKYTFAVEVVDELEITSRGVGGFGSTES